MSTAQTTRQSYDLFDLLFLSSSRNHGDHNSPITRIVMLIGQIILATALMFILPTFIQYIVNSIDEIYLLIGRTASSPFSSIPWASLGAGIVVLLLWHVALGRISYLAVMGSQDGVTEGQAKEEDGENLNKKTSNFSWDRILSRIILPLLLLTFSISFTLNLASRLLFPKAGINTNSSLPSAS